MVVGYNEEKLLPACLSSLWFCDEIIYTDLNSTDASIDIASQYTDKIFYRQIVPSCEYIQSEIINYTTHEWVVFIDPDEVIDKILGQEIINNFLIWQTNDNIGAIEVPWQFYFKKHKLKGTIWGGLNKKVLMANKKRFEFKPIIHHGRSILPEFEIFQLNFNGKSNVLHHYWMNNWTVFWSKHQRYVEGDIIYSYEHGRRYSKKEVLFKPLEAFIESFIKKKGYKDYFLGFFLSLFWSYYKTRVAIGSLILQSKAH